VSTASAPVAVIGGSGLYSLFDAAASESRTIPTPYGSVEVTTGTLGTRPALLLPRHGTGPSVAPHRIPYRANIWALASLGARAIISAAAVGAVDPAYPVGTLALPDQYLDRTRGRGDTFFDDDDVQHLPSADPFCPELREIAKQRTNAQPPSPSSPAPASPPAPSRSRCARPILTDPSRRPRRRDPGAQPP
jgi:5'-methylthioadenosine phosphorylase